MIALRYQAEGYRDVQGRFSRRTEQLARMQRDLARDEGREMVRALREAAPEKTGKFKEGIHYRTDVRHDGTTVTVYVRGEHAFLLPLLTEGTRPHQIPKGGSAEQMAKGYPLRFYWEKGPKGAGIYHFWSVQHPGFPPQFFVARVIEQRLPHMRRNLQSVARRIAYTGGM